MDKSSKRQLSLALMVCLVMGMVPLTANAAGTTADVEAAVAAYGNGGGTGSLATSAIDDIVTVTGTVTGALVPLSLNIGSGVTVMWEAALTGTVSGPDNNCLIHLDGDGTFEVAPSGCVTCNGTSGYAVYSVATAGTIKVCGSIVSAVNSISIRADKEDTAIVVEGGTVEAADAYAINTDGDVTISEGVISSTGDYTTICAQGSVALGGSNTVISAADGSAIEAGYVAITGGTISAHGYYATIFAHEITISGEDTVISAGLGSAIQVNSGTLTILGGTVEGTGDNSSAVVEAFSGDSVITLEGGNVRATGEQGVAIYTPAYLSTPTATINIHGGTVSATMGKAIYAPGAGTMVNISGGTVEVTGGTAIDVVQETTEDFWCGQVILTGGTVRATNGTAIVGAVILVKSGKAVNVTSEGPGPAVKTVNGGTIYVDDGDMTINGDLETSDCGVEADNGSIVYITGHIQAGGNGVTASDGAQVTVSGSMSTGAYGVVAEDGAVVTVIGGIEAKGGDGINAGNSGTIVTVTGNIKAKNVGVLGSGGVSVTVTGDVESGNFGIYSQDDADIYVDGDVESHNEATGNPPEGYTGLTAGDATVCCDNAKAEVTGKVTSSEIGVCGIDGAEVTIGGEIDAAETYIRLYNSIKVGDEITDFSTDDDIESSKLHYKAYTDGVSTVWVKEPGLAQTVTFATPGPVAKTYGDVAFSNAASGPSGGGAISYTSGNTDVAAVNASTGQVTIKGAGTAVITATAAKTIEYDEGAAAYTLTVGKAALTVKPKDLSIKSGAAMPAVALEYLGLKSIDVGATVAAPVSGNLDMQIRNAADTGILTDTSKSGTYKIVFSGSPVFNTAGNYTITTSDGTLTISASTGGGSVGGGGGGGGGGVVLPQTTLPVGDGTVAVNYTQSGAAISLEMPSGKVSKIIGTAADGVASLDLSELSEATSANMPQSALFQFADAGLGVELKLPQGSVTLDGNAVKAVAEQAGGDNVSVSLSAVGHSALTSVQSAAINSDDLVFSISVSSGTKAIHNFDGSITVTIPYDGPTPVAVWYLSDTGELEKLDAVYDAATKTVTFKTSHLSLYAVGADKETSTAGISFSDVTADTWYYEGVMKICEKGLMNGTSADLFSPDEPLSRAMMVTILYRHAGKPDAQHLPNLFNDVAQGQWYTDAVKWAADSKIVDGYSDGNFCPEDILTRQDLAVILRRYMDFLKVNLPVTQQWVTFTDEDDISDYATNAIQNLYKFGVITGVGGNRIDPKGSATRAQIAVVLERFAAAIGQ